MNERVRVRVAWHKVTLALIQTNDPTNDPTNERTSDSSKEHPRRLRRHARAKQSSIATCRTNADSPRRGCLQRDVPLTAL